MEFVDLWISYWNVHLFQFYTSALKSEECKESFDSSQWRKLLWLICEKWTFVFQKTEFISMSPKNWLFICVWVHWSSVDVASKDTHTQFWWTAKRLLMEIKFPKENLALLLSRVCWRSCFHWHNYSSWCPI